LAQAEQLRPANQSDGARSGWAGGNGKAPPPWATELSGRDVKVLRLLAEGQSTAEIAVDLAYSESTIKNVIHDMVGQLGARNRAHAVALAIRGGVI
jgi:DNA-binding NarL/FixJ family response regulator